MCTTQHKIIQCKVDQVTIITQPAHPNHLCVGWLEMLNMQDVTIYWYIVCCFTISICVYRYQAKLYQYITYRDASMYCGLLHWLTIKLLYIMEWYMTLFEEKFGHLRPQIHQCLDSTLHRAIYQYYDIVKRVYCNGCTLYCCREGSLYVSLTTPPLILSLFLFRISTGSPHQ